MVLFSVTVIVTFTNLNAQQASAMSETISSSTAATQLQEVFVNASPVLAAVTVVALNGKSCLLLNFKLLEETLSAFCLYHFN